MLASDTTAVTSSTARRHGTISGLENLEAEVENRVERRAFALLSLPSAESDDPATLSVRAEVIVPDARQTD